ncbi:MAG: maleylpyruvate isomerase N-terminal domain-containing protein [Streptosporangiaceae bacterium]
MPDPTDQLARALRTAEQIIAAIGEQDWAAPTVCTGLSVRDVAGHLITGQLFFAAVRRPFAPPQPVADSAPAIDRLAALLGRPVTGQP